MIAVDKPTPSQAKRGWRIWKDWDFLDYFDVMSKAAITFGGVSVAYLAYSLQLTVQQRALDDRMASRAAELERRFSPGNGQRSSEAEVPSALIQFAIRGSPSERRAAVLMLVQVAPRLVVDLSAVLQATAANEADARFAREIGIEASDREITNTFLDRLNLAREFLTHGMDDRACTQYLRAWNILPVRFAPLVDHAAFDRGLLNCSLPIADYAEGAKALQKVFSKIGSQ